MFMVAVTIKCSKQCRSKLIPNWNDVADILILFNDGLQFPNNELAIRPWCEVIAKNLTEYFPKANDNPKLNDM